MTSSYDEKDLLALLTKARALRWGFAGVFALEKALAIRCDDDDDDGVVSTASPPKKKPRDPKDWLYKHQLVFCPKCKCIYSLTCTEHGVKWNDGD